MVSVPSLLLDMPSNPRCSGLACRPRGGAMGVGVSSGTRPRLSILQVCAAAPGRRHVHASS